MAAELDFVVVVDGSTGAVIAARRSEEKAAELRGEDHGPTLARLVAEPD